MFAWCFLADKSADDDLQQLPAETLYFPEPAAGCLPRRSPPTPAPFRCRFLDEWDNEEARQGTGKMKCDLHFGLPE